MLCFECKTGYMLPVDPLEYRADWTCEKCGATVPFKTVDDVISTIESQVVGQPFNIYFYAIP